MNSYTRVRATILSRKPSAAARETVFWSWMALAAGWLFFARDLRGWGEWMPASRELVYAQHQYWRLWTALLAHSDLAHFAANSLMFVILGYFLCGYFGWRLFPLAAFFFGGVINALSVLTYPAQTLLLGASGMVTWMGGAWLALYVFLNRERTVAQRCLRAAGVTLLLFAPSETFDPQVSYRTHLIGYVLGWFWGSIHYLSRRREFRQAEVLETVIEEDFVDGQSQS